VLKDDQNSPEYADEDAPHVTLLEFDERFSVLEGFVQYDFHSPLKLPRTSLLLTNFVEGG